jgi:excisionase family DNA binding protein
VIIIEELFTVKEAAAYLKITEQAVRDYIASGQLEASKLGRVWRITETDIIKFLHKMKPVSGQAVEVNEIDQDTDK